MTRPFKRGELPHCCAVMFVFSWLVTPALVIWPCFSEDDPVAVTWSSGSRNDPFLSFPISPKLPEELKLPCAEKLPSL